MVWKKLRFLIGTFVLTFVSSGLAGQVGPQTMTFDGRAFGNAEASVPMLDIISTKIQILTPAQDCVLYEETQSVDTRATNGYFTIQIGSVVSDPKRTGYDSNLAMSKVFANSSTAVTGKRVTDGSACSYNSSAGDKRYVRVQMTPAADGVTRSISPNMALDSVPNAMVAETVQGLAPSDFVQVNNASSTVLSQSNLENIFSSSNYPNLVNLLSVAPTSYVRTGANGSASLPSVAGNPASGLTAGQIWYDSTMNVIKYYDGATKTLGTSTGLTSVGLTMPSIFTVTGSPLTANGSITAALANQSPNLVFAGPAGSTPAPPTFRALVAADLPVTGATGAYVNGGNSFAAAATLGTNDSNTFAIKTNNTARMSFDTSGNVSIGTGVLNITTATAGNVEVLRLANSNGGGNASGMGFYVNSTKQSEIYSYDNNLTFNLATASGTMLWRSNGSTKMTMDKDGHFGIGTTSTMYSPLEVQSDGTNSSINPAITLRNNTTANFDVGTSIDFAGINNKKLGRMISSWTGGSGNEGDAQMSFQTRLDDSLYDNLFLGADGMNSMYANSTTGNTIADNLKLYHSSHSVTGSNGIGTSISFNMETTTESTYAEAGKISSVFDDADPASKDSSLRFSTIGPNAGGGVTTASERMRIDSRGYLGIGTTSPSTIIGIGGDSGRTIGMERNSVSDTAGNYLNIQAGGATVGATNKSGGELSLASGISTGNGGSNIRFYVAYASQGSGTTTRAPSADMVTFSGDYRSVSMGQGAAAGGLYSTAVGYNMKVDGDNSFGINLDTTLRTITRTNVMAINGGAVGVGTIDPKAGLDVATTGANSAIVVPRDTTANRPSTAVEGMVRYNTTNKSFEGYQDAAWQKVQASNIICATGAQTGTGGTAGACVRQSDGKLCFRSSGATAWNCLVPTNWPGDANWQCGVTYGTAYRVTCIRITDGNTCVIAEGGTAWSCAAPTGWDL